MDNLEDESHDESQSEESHDEPLSEESEQELADGLPEAREGVNDPGAICIICREGAHGLGRLYQVCNCGAHAYYHFHCLVDWIYKTAQDQCRYCVDPLTNEPTPLRHPGLVRYAAPLPLSERIRSLIFGFQGEEMPLVWQVACFGLAISGAMQYAKSYEGHEPNENFSLNFLIISFFPVIRRIYLAINYPRLYMHRMILFGSHRFAGQYYPRRRIDMTRRAIEVNEGQDIEDANQIRRDMARQQHPNQGRAPLLPQLYAEGEANMQALYGRFGIQPPAMPVIPEEEEELIAGPIPEDEDSKCNIM